MLSIYFRAAGLAVLAAGMVSAQEPNARPSGTEFGFFTFQTKCMTCHGNPNVERAPLPSAIREMTPERIYEALTNGVMKAQGQSLSDPEKRTLALFMSGRPVGSIQQGDAKNMPNQCSAKAPLSDPRLARPGTVGESTKPMRVFRAQKMPDSPQPMFLS